MSEHRHTQSAAKDWQDEWASELRHFHVSERELSDFVDAGDFSSRAASHLLLCVTCRERLAFEIEGAILEQPREGREFDSFVNLLQHHEACVRASAARAVVALATELPGAVGALAALRNDSSPTVRDDVATVLAALSDDSDSTVSREAAAVLAKGLAAAAKASATLAPARNFAEWKARHAEEMKKAMEHAHFKNEAVDFDESAVDFEQSAVNFAGRRLHHWPMTWPDGGELVISLDLGPDADDRVLTLVTIRTDLNGKLVSCFLGGRGSDTLGDSTLKFWMVLHEDSTNAGQFHASVRLDPLSRLPRELLPAASATPPAPLPAECLEQAIRQAASAEDRTALENWAKANNGGVLGGR